MQTRVPIGVYDSGFGGLTVLRELVRALPAQDFIYLGDAGRAPYGGRDAHVVLDLAEQCVERLFEEGCRLIVVACHTVSSVALRHLQRRYAGPGSERRVLGVTIPAAEAAVARSRGRIGFLGTSRTVASRTFTTEVHKLASHQVEERAAPLLAAVVEEGWEDSDVARLCVARYLDGWPELDTLVLGCTHYPLLWRAFEAALPPGVTLLDPAPFVAERLREWLRQHPAFTAPGNTGPGRGSLRVLSSGEPGAFTQHGERFFGAPLPAIEHVAEEGGRLTHRASPPAPLGQVMRPS